MEEHTEDLRNVQEGDIVSITTTEGETFDAECISREVQRAAEITGEVRRTTIWMFDTPLGQIATNILDGLKSSPDDPDFPQHSSLWNMDKLVSEGYAEELTIFGEAEE